MRFEINLDKRAKSDIDKALDYYNEKQKGLGKKFLLDVSDALATLEKNPFFQIRYDDYRCLPLKKFPYMIHYIVDESASRVIAYAVINTSQNPETNWLK